MCGLERVCEEHEEGVRRNKKQGVKLREVLKFWQEKEQKGRGDEGVER